MAVTLITGDTVLWQDNGDGNPRVEIEQAPRDFPVTFDQSGTQEDFYVIPTDVMGHVVAGRVDRELFNVPALVRQGLGDTATNELPVIVTFDHDRSAKQLAREAHALPATGEATVVERVNGAGVRVDRDKAGSFRQAVLGDPGRDGSARAAGATELGRGVEEVLLDRTLEIDLAESVPQIGAPQAWAAGFTGEGVTVAVLDTGIDSSHPDLAGQVVAAANFTNEPDTADTHGHGTHVASIIAGTGTASDGARTGVAPGADLLVGKVCTADGQCQTSSIMAGMEWAVAQGADVVNMSLGGDPTDGSDPLSQLVDKLSVDTGALFVVSAGNRRRAQTVGAPAAANAALAVGAVTKSDQLASFSSRGPRIGDHAVKPEITAPGAGIIAALAQGTSQGSPIDEDYTSLNGTSMAAPHVAGAAALLAQARPNLGGYHLKDALVSTATDVGRMWWEQGVGRVDVPSALDGRVYATGTVNLGQVTDRAAQDITYTNHGDMDITLALDVAITDNSGHTLDVASLSSDILTVPAGGTATTTVTVDVTRVPGRQDLLGGGVVTATGEGVHLRTGLGFGPIRHRVTIEILDSHGNLTGSPTSDDGLVHIAHDTYDPANPIGSPDYSLSTSDGTATGHLPTGIYTLYTEVRERDPDSGAPRRSSLLVEVERIIDSDTIIMLDARHAVPIEQPDMPRELDQRNHAVTLIHQRSSIDPEVTTSVGTSAASHPMWVTPTPPGKLGFVALWVHWILAEPQPVFPLPVNGELCTEFLQPFWCYSPTPAHVYNLSFLYENGIPDQLHEKVTRRDLVEVPTRFHSDHLDALIMHQFEAFPPIRFAAGVGVQQRIWIEPGEVTEHFLADDRFTWKRGAHAEAQPAGARAVLLSHISFDRFPLAEAGSTRATESWGEAPLRVGAADLREEFFGGSRSIPPTAAASRGGADGNQLVPGYQNMDNTRGHLAGPFRNWPAFASWRLWNADTGAELEGVEFNPNLPGVTAFALAPEDANYRLEQVDQWERLGELVRTGPAITTWTFASHPSNAEVPHGYACAMPPVDACQIQPLIQLEYQLSLDIHNRAPAGRAHRFTILAGHHSRAIDRAPVTALSVQASFDDGTTWQSARVVGKPKDSFGTGGVLPSSEPYQQYRVVLMHPPLHRTNGYVTLRVQAKDANGGTIEQVIRRAYILE